MKKVGFVSVSSILMAIMTIVAAGSGICRFGIYSGLAEPFARFFGTQDFLVITTIVPLLLIATWFSGQSSFRGILTWIGIVGYLSYFYAGYAFGKISTELSLLHIAILSLSFLTLTARLAAVDAEAIRLQFLPVTPFHFTALFLIIAGLVIEGYWLKPLISIFPDFFPNPPVVVPPALFIMQVMDVGFIGPLSILAGLWLWARKAWGYVFTAMLLIILTIKFGTMAPLIGSPPHLQPEQADLISYFLAIITLILLISFLKKLREEKITDFHNRISNSF